MKAKIDSKKRKTTSNLDADCTHMNKKPKGVTFFNQDIEMSSELSSTEDETYLESEPYKFYINGNKRGKIGKTKYTPDGVIKCPNPETLPVVGGLNFVINIPVIASTEKKSVKLQYKLQTESFGDTLLDSETQTKNKMSVVFGVNKLKSVCVNNNKVLYEELIAPIDSNFPYKRIGFFWKPHWEMIKPEGYRLNLFLIKKEPEKILDETSKKKPPKYKKITISTIPKGCVSPALIMDLNAEELFIYGKWLGEEASLKALEKSEFDFLFKQEPIPKQILVSNGSYQTLFDAIIKIKGHSGETQPVKLSKVRGWLLDSDENTKIKKKQHIENEEKKSKLKMIPYQEIRDTVKDSNECLSLLKHAQGKGKQTYMMFFDSSIDSLKTTKGTGVISCYEKIISKYEVKHNKYPVVVSTGYRIDSEKHRFDSIGIQYDMDVRTETNKFNENSIYPPEPNFGILTLPNAKVESFSNGVKNYVSPKESPTLIKNIMKKRNLRSDELGSVFNGKYAIPIEVRPRMLLKSKKGDQKEFTGGKINFRGEVVNWNQQFFTNFRNTSQSHFKPKQWAESTLDKYVLSGAKVFEKGVAKEHILKASDVKCMLVSLLSKLFTAYDPISITKKIIVNNFNNKLTDVLNNYHKITPYIIEVERAQNSHPLYLSVFDKAKTVEDIREHVCSLSTSVGKDFDKINQAAKSAGQKIFENIYLGFCVVYPRMVDELLRKFITEFTYSTLEELKDMHMQMINNICDDNFSITRWANLGNFQMSYLHLAALAGNTEYVRFLLDNNLMDKNIKAMYDILPLHCAIKYYIKHDEEYDFIEKYETDLVLIELLADQYNLFKPMANKKTAMYIILTELPKPMVIIERLKNKGYIKEPIYALLKIYLDLLDKHKIAFEEFNNPLVHIIERIKDTAQAAKLIALFIQWGADCHENLRKEECDFPEWMLDSPVFLAIKRGDASLIRALYHAREDICIGVNCNNLPPLLAALCNNASLNVLKALYDCGTSLCDTNEDITPSYPITCAIIEMVVPSLGGRRNEELLKYIVATSEPEEIIEFLTDSYYDNDDSDVDDFSDDSRNLLDMVIEQEDVKAIEILLFNKDGEPSEAMALLSEEKREQISTFMPALQFENRYRF